MSQRLLLSFCFACFLLQNVNAQDPPSQRAAYEQTILRSIQDGTFQPEECAHSLPSFPASQLKACPILNTGFGTNGWQPTSGPGGNGLDPACAIPAVPVPACSGSKYRVPVAITVFENPAWPNANYLNGTGFLSLPDADINAALANMNFYYANANIEFYEARPRQRIVNVDMYDFYTPFLGGPDPVVDGNDGIDDDPQTAAFDASNIINIYFVGGLNGDHDASGVTGYAPLPSSRDYTIMAYRAVFGTTLYHELGHYLGLFHTHNNVGTGNDNNCYPPDGNLNNSNCLSTNDQICDTWPDPNFSANSGACRNVSCVYQTAPVCCGVLTISDAAGTNYGGGSSSILRNNIMNYNSFSGCRTDFSPCQYRKVHDVLLSCRNNLCDNDVERHFASTVLNDANSPYKSICVGDAIPTFNALAGGCYNWYSAETGGVPIATGTSTFTPTALQLDVNTPGTTLFYIQEVNSFNTDCRQAVEVVVSPSPGDGQQQATAATSIALNGGNNNICVTTVGANLGTDEIVGWWLTHGNPASALVNDQASLDALLGTATVNGAVATIAPNHVFISAAGSPLREVCVDLDCAVLDADSTYFLTPFVSLDDQPAPANFTAGPTVVGSATVPDTSETTILVAQLPANATLTAVNMNLTHQVLNDLRMWLVAPNGAVVNLSSFFAFTHPIGNINASWVDNGSGYTAYNSACNAGGPCYTGNLESTGSFAPTDGQPNGTWKLYIRDGNNAGFTGTLNSIELVFDQAAQPITFPDVTYSSCVFGNAISLNCPNVVDVSTGLGCYNGSKVGVSGSVWHNILDGSGNIIAAINPNGTDLGTVTVDINDMASVLQDGDGRHYLPRYWNFESDNFNGIGNPFTNGPINVRIYLLDAELAAYNAAASMSATAGDLNLTHYAGVNENCDIMDNNYATGTTELISSADITTTAYNTGSGNGFQLEFQLSHFSELGAAGVSDALPLNLLSFTGKAVNKQVQLDWLTDNEINTHHFVIERSSDNLTFFAIGEVAAKGGTIQNSYTFVDAMPQSGYNYYRLRQVDVDDKFEISPTVVVTFSNHSDISIIPNPIKEDFTLAYYNADAATDQISVFDVAGKLVYMQSTQTIKGMNYLQLDIPNLAAGIYVLKLQQKTGLRIIRFSK